MTATRTTVPPALELTYRRRAVRAFRSDPVDPATIQTLLAAAVQAPTAMHLEPWVFAIVQDRRILKRYSDLAKALAAGGPAAHAGLARTPEAPARTAPAILADPDFNIFYNAGTLIVIGARPLGPFVTADCWLAAENLMLAATALGLGTCCIGLAIPALNQPETKRELGLPEDVAAVAAIIVGVPSAVPAPVPRRPAVVLGWLR